MKRFLVFRFDVTGLSEEEVDGLALEVAVQAESSDHHPSVPAPESKIVTEEQVPSILLD